jgi:hypothetical protein
MSLSTPNSSFILDLLLRSIRLCAVFRAIFLPAAVVGPDVLGGFLLPPVVVVVAAEGVDDTCAVDLEAGGAGAIIG